MSYGSKRFCRIQRPRARGKGKKRKKYNPNNPSPNRLTLDGITYCNELEHRIAKLLKKHNIPFEYSKRFETIDEDGNPNHREVDFWLLHPIRVFWVDDPLQAIEAKGGKLDDRCWNQKKELNEAGVKTWIATPRYVSFWERYGFLRDNGMYKKPNKGQRP